MLMRKKRIYASGEDYLEAILVLQKEKGMVRSIDVARHLDVSKPSVCHAVSALKEGGFLTMDEDSFLYLTDADREAAEQTSETHYFFTRLPIDSGVDPEGAEQDFASNTAENMICRLRSKLEPSPGAHSILNQ